MLLRFLTKEMQQLQCTDIIKRNDQNITYPPQKKWTVIDITYATLGRTAQAQWGEPFTEDGVRQENRREPDWIEEGMYIFRMKTCGYENTKTALC